MPAITVVLVASAGGERLRASLDSATWAPRVAVLDPAGRAELSSLPAGTARWRPSELAARLGADWLLLLAEGERVTAALRAALVRVTQDGAAGAGAATAYRVSLEYAVFGAMLRPRAAPVRLCRGAPDGIGLSKHGQLSLRTPARPATLDAAVRVERAATLIDGVYELDRDAAAWAALEPPGTAVGALRTIRVGTASLLRTLLGRGSGRLGWGRLVLAVLHGYRAVLTLAKSWEAQRGPAT